MGDETSLEEGKIFFRNTKIIRVNDICEQGRMDEEENGKGHWWDKGGRMCKWFALVVGSLWSSDGELGGILGSRECINQQRLAEGLDIKELNWYNDDN